MEKMDTTDVNVYSEIGDGRRVKMTIDCSKQVQQAINEAEKFSKDGNLTGALDALYAVEKESRVAFDLASNICVQLKIVELCYEKKNWDSLCENIKNLARKRSLIKMAVTKMVQKCCTFLDDKLDRNVRMKIIETIRAETEGKIYLEVERARLTSKLSKMLEQDGKLDEAASRLLELQIETYGSMDKQEKVEILLEQMRLCLDKKDYVRAQIISRKISPKFFDDKSLQIQNLKLKYYQLVIQLDQTEENYLSICRHYLAICNTEIIENNSYKLDDTMRNVVLYVILARYSNEQNDLANRILLNKTLNKISVYKELLKLFLNEELISWQGDLIKKFEAPLRTGTKTSPPTGVFSSESEIGKKQWENLQTRVGEHNIRIVSKYYSCISLKRLAELLDWPVEKTETFLCQLIVDGTIEFARIDRPAGLVNFTPKKSTPELLDEWLTVNDTITRHLNQASHLIFKEEMVHKHLHVNDSIK